MLLEVCLGGELFTLLHCKIVDRLDCLWPILSFMVRVYSMDLHFCMKRVYATGI